jgi:small subunit ribosomal protein S14
MAKKGQLARERKRAKLRGLQAEKRAELKKMIINEELEDDARRDAMFKLSSMKRDGSPSRHVRRCQHTGVSRAVYRRFKLNRIAFRELALQGMLPGVTKASW